MLQPRNDKALTSLEFKALCVRQRVSVGWLMGYKTAT
jgi:hypothetical protein